MLKNSEFYSVFPGVSFDTSIYMCPLLAEGSLFVVSHFLLCGIWYFLLASVMVAVDFFFSLTKNCLLLMRIETVKLSVLEELVTCS